MPSYAAIAPIAQHRGREPQLACDLDQRPTAARQQGDRLRLELIRKMTPFLAHSTPSRSRRSLAKVSTNSGEAQCNARLPRETVLADGSYLTTIYPSEKDRRHRTEGVRVRAIEYRLEGVADAEPLYRLVTTILDPAPASAADLAALYHERWEIEGALAELKTHLRGARVVLRSKTPELVRQEFWGLLLAHFAVRGLMHEAALRADEDPDRLSFLHAVRVVRRKLPLFAALPPSVQACPA